MLHMTSVKVNNVFSCYSVQLLLITGSRCSSVLQNPGGDVTAHLANILLTTGAWDLVNTQFLSPWWI
jgi:hypothetical protein